MKTILDYKHIVPIAHALDLPEELVFKEAGLLSRLSSPPDLYEYIYLFTHLPQKERQELLDYMHWKLDRAEIEIPQTEEKEIAPKDETLEAIKIWAETHGYDVTVEELGIQTSLVENQSAQDG